MIQQTLQNALQKKDVDREVVTFISQVIVDKNDPTIKNPTKFIGKSYSKKLYVFATVEKKIGSYINGNPKDKNNREYLNIITPSNWCKNGLIACGFDDNQITVIPHGVDIKTFHKISDEEVDKYRSDLKINKEDFILTNVGAMSGNKGIHYLIIAFAILKQKFQNLKLILKDQSNLYDKKAEEYLDMIKTTKYGKYLAIGGFAFFFIKGLIWLAVIFSVGFSAFNFI